MDRQAQAGISSAKGKTLWFQSLRYGSSLPLRTLVSPGFPTSIDIVLNKRRGIHRSRRPASLMFDIDSEGFNNGRSTWIFIYDPPAPSLHIVIGDKHMRRIFD